VERGDECLMPLIGTSGCARFSRATILGRPVPDWSFEGEGGNPLRLGGRRATGALPIPFYNCRIALDEISPETSEASPRA